MAIYNLRLREAMSRRLSGERSAVRRGITASGIVVALLLVVVIVALSPVVMVAIGGLVGVDWAKLSKIGQAYGASSAVLSGLALSGVAVSLLFQVRESAANRREAARTFFHELMHLAMADPAYLECWSPLEQATFEQEKQFMYCNMILSFWEREYEAGRIPDAALSRYANQFFRGEAGRRYWATFGEKRIAWATTRRERRFRTIMQKVFKDAPADNPEQYIGQSPESVIVQSPVDETR